jgi:AraC-like DNA-binding protein
MSLIVRAPCPVLASFVERVGYYSGHSLDRLEPVMPTGTMHVLVNLAADEIRWFDGVRVTAHTRRPAVVSAPSAEPFSLSLTEWRAVVFVCFRPGGAYPFVGPPASTIDEPLVELETFWGRDGALLRERILEAPTAEGALTLMEEALLAHAVRPLEPDPVVAWTVMALDRDMPVAEAVEHLGLSHSTLLRRFTAQVGLTPKRFARVRRLQRLLASVPAGPSAEWAAAAAECGYSDQAHLIKDFRALAGMTPSQYRPRRPDPHDPELPLC